MLLAETERASEAGITPVPEFNLPAEMQTPDDLDFLLKCKDEIMRVQAQQLERGKEVKQRNAEALEALRDKNAVLKKKLEENDVLAQEDEDSQEQQSKRTAEKDLAIKKRKLDDLKTKTATKRQQLNKLQQRVEETNVVTDDTNDDDHPMMRQIRTLNNRLDKIMIKYNEAVQMRKTFEVVHTKLSEERSGYEKQLTQLEQALKQKNTSFSELIKLSQLAQSSARPTKADDPKKTHEVLRLIEAQSGGGTPQTLMQIAEKAEKYMDTGSSLAEMRKNLQVKAIQLLQKRDSLQQQLDSEQDFGDLDDEATKAKKFDQKEKRMLALKHETEAMQEQLERTQRKKAEIAQGISNLSQRLGISACKDLPDTISQCDAKIKELLVQRKQMGSANRSAPMASPNIGGGNSSMRVSDMSRRPSIYSDARTIGAGGMNASDEDESSDDDLFKRNKRGRR